MPSNDNQADDVALRSLSQIHLANSSAATEPASWAATKAGTPAGAIPENVSDKDRAIVTAGLANDVEAVNQ